MSVFELQPISPVVQFLCHLLNSLTCGGAGAALE